MICLISLFSFILSLSAFAQNFEVSYKVPDKKPSRTVKVYLIISQSYAQDLAGEFQNWFKPPFLFCIDDPKLTGSVTFNQNTLGFPKAIKDIPKGRYKIQAFVRINEDYFIPGKAAGDQYSKMQRTTIDHSNELNKIECDKVVPLQQKQQKGRIVFNRFKSRKMSAFFKRDYHINYSVALPKDYDASKKYPVVVYNPGYTGTYKHVEYATHELDSRVHQCITVILDPNCYWGHSVYANSATNGPWCDVMVDEFLPYIDTNYGGAGPKHRYLTGVSSGGWSSLWLMIQRPEAFAGTWSYAPDPLDFKNFQLYDFYNQKDKDLYRKNDGTLKPMSTPLQGNQVLTYKSLGSFEHVLHAGGQLQSFGAVFSPCQPNGDPQPWFDPKTGIMHHDVITQWKGYDVCRIFPALWKEKHNDYKGKINLLVHQNDIFFLTHSVRAFEKVCKAANADVQFTYLPGSGHHIPKASTKSMFDRIAADWEARIAQ